MTDVVMDRKKLVEREFVPTTIRKLKRVGSLHQAQSLTSAKMMMTMAQDLLVCSFALSSILMMMAIR
jgi:hypothetical protein